MRPAKHPMGRGADLSVVEMEPPKAVVPLVPRFHLTPMVPLVAGVDDDRTIYVSEWIPNTAERALLAREGRVRVVLYTKTPIPIHLVASSGVPAGVGGLDQDYLAVRSGVAAALARRFPGEDAARLRRVTEDVLDAVFGGGS